jgi:hypothetical protein
MTSKRPASEQVVVQAPMSLSGSAARIWKITAAPGPARLLLIPAALVLIALAWVVVVVWYACFSLLLVPYRLIRRGSRKRKRDALRHREVLSAVEDRRA